MRSWGSVGHLRMAVEENKEAVITTSLLLYLGIYLLLGLSGLSFPSQLAAAYAPDSYTDADPSGNVWVTSSDVPVNITVSDPEGDNIDVTFYDASDDTSFGSDSIASGGTAQTTWSGLADGSYSWYAEGCDTNTTDPGGDCSTSGTYDFRVDATDPTVSIDHSPTMPTDSDTVTFNATASDGGSGLSEIRVYVDGTLQATCTTSPCTYDGGPYTEGTSHTYTAEADDVAGNTNSDSGSFTVNAYPDAPTDPSPSDGAMVTTSDVSLSANYTDPDGDDGTLTYYNASSGSQIGSCSVSSGNRCSVTWSGLPDGNHSWYAVAEDTHGDTATSATWEFEVDTTSPSVDATTTSPTSDTRQSIFYEVNESNFNDCSITDDGGTGVTWSCSESAVDADTYEGQCDPQSDISDGSYTLVLTCTDTAGNSGSDTVDLVVDTTPPSSSCSDCDSPDPVRNGNEITFSPTVSDGAEGSGVDLVEICRDDSCTDTYCTYDNDVTNSCSYETPDFSYSINDFWVRSTDQVGNTEPLSATPDGSFTVKKWIGQSCSADEECLLGACTAGSCQVERIPSPIIIFR